MPLPIIAGAITAGAGLIGNIWNNASIARQNRLNKQFAQQQYEKQRADQLDFWRQNNAYNHPTAQMERLRTAGLNPHLVYGNGTVGNAASAPTAPTQARWEGRPQNVDASFAPAAMDQMYNLEAKKAQTDNLRAQNTLLRQDAMLKLLEGEKRKVDIAKGVLGYDFDKQSFQGRLQKLFAETDEITSRELTRYNMDSRAEDLHKGNLRSQALDNALKELDLQLWDQGISRSDPLYQRIIAKLIQSWSKDDGSNPFWRDWNPGYKVYKRFIDKE